MGSKKTIAIVLLVLGIAILAVSLLADVIGLGGSPRFGYRQIVGVIVGAVAAIAGLVLARKK